MGKSKKLYIRPCSFPDTILAAIAVCSTNGPLLRDEQVLAWFSADATGREIRDWYKGHDGGPYYLVWGTPLNSPVRGEQ